MARFEDRTAQGIDVLSTLTGSAEAGRGIASLFESLGALGSLGLRGAAGEVWSRNELSRRDRSLVVISMLTALGHELELQQHVAGGLHHGLTRDEIDETMVQLSQYVGMPPALAGAGIASRVFAERDGSERRSDPPAPMEPKDDEERRADGLDVLTTLLGMPPGSDMHFAADATLEQLGPIGRFVLDTAFGEVWARPNLSRRDRSLVVIAALGALNLTHELGIHLRGALNHGVTRTEIQEVMLTLVVYGGFPRAIDGIHLAHALFAELDGTAPEGAT